MDLSFGRAKLDRAERVAEQLAERRVLNQFRRMDEHAVRQRLVERLVEETDDEESKVGLRLTEYGRQARKWEKRRQEAVAHLIRQGLIEADAGWLAAERYKRDGKWKRTPNTQKKFTDRQMEIALKSLERQ